MAQHAGVTVTRVGAHLGAEINGVDLRKPLSEEVRDAVEEALAENALLVFRNQDPHGESARFEVESIREGIFRKR